MPIQASDIQVRYSTKLGSAGNSRAQIDPNLSIGKYMSQTAWPGDTIHDLFDLITGEQNTAEQVDYRCVFVYNTHSDLTLWGAKIWLSAVTADGADMAIGVDPTAASLQNASSAQAVSAATDAAAPVGVSFSAPLSAGAALSLGDIGPGKCKAVWLRRTATDSDPINDDSFTLTIRGDTNDDGLS